MSQRLIVGIDPGATTGFAVLDPARGERGELLTCEGLLIHHAMRRVESMALAGTLKLVVYEDARLRTWFGTKGKEALQGAGSIKRDSSIWADFLADLGCPVLAAKPQAGATKWDAKLFQRMTGYAGRTNEHARDAACLVWGRR